MKRKRTKPPRLFEEEIEKLAEEVEKQKDNPLTELCLKLLDRLWYLEPEMEGENRAWKRGRQSAYQEITEDQQELFDQVENLRRYLDVQGQQSLEEAASWLREDNIRLLRRIVGCRTCRAAAPEQLNVEELQEEYNVE